MKEAINKISFQEFTRLQTREVVKADSMATAILVKTPHRGEVGVEYKEISRPMFGADNSVEKQTIEVIRELVKLEDDSTEHLFKEWLNKNL